LARAKRVSAGGMGGATWGEVFRLTNGNTMSSDAWVRNDRTRRRMPERM
jgi:hypothetical protein